MNIDVYDGSHQIMNMYKEYYIYTRDYLILMIQTIQIYETSLEGSRGLGEIWVPARPALEKTV